MKNNILVAGCGYWGKNLVRNFHELGCLKFVADTNKEILEAISNEYQVEAIDYDDGVKSEYIDAVVIASPAQFHEEMALKAINQNKDVYIEKPLSLTTESATRIIEAAKRKSVKVMVGHLLQYHPVFEDLKKLVKEGLIGDITYLYSNRMSFGKVRTNEDVIWSFAPHDISMILSIAGKNPMAITATKTSTVQDSISDTSHIHLEFGHINAHIFVSWLSPFKEQKFVISGKKGSLIFDDTQDWDKKLMHVKHTVEIADGNPVLNKSDHEFIKVEFSEPLKKECKYFVDLINNKVPSRTGGKEGLSVIKTLMAASESANLNKRIELKNEK